MCTNDLEPCLGFDWPRFVSVIPTIILALFPSWINETVVGHVRGFCRKKLTHLKVGGQDQSRLCQFYISWVNRGYKLVRHITLHTIYNLVKQLGKDYNFPIFL